MTWWFQLGILVNTFWLVCIFYQRSNPDVRKERESAPPQSNRVEGPQAQSGCDVGSGAAQASGEDTESAIPSHRKDDVVSRHEIKVPFGAYIGGNKINMPPMVVGKNVHVREHCGCEACQLWRVRNFG